MSLDISRIPLDGQSGKHVIPMPVLAESSEDVLAAASKAYGDLVLANPSIQFNMILDQNAGNLTIYWNRLT